MRNPALQPCQREFLEEHGYLRLPGFHSPAQVDRLRQQILEELKRRGIWASGRTISSQLAGVPPFQQVARLSSLVKIPALHHALVTPNLVGIISALAGGARVASQDAQLLLSLPHQRDWTLDGLNWHVDIAADPSSRLPGLQVFFLIDDVVPRGGATLALAGSHRRDGQRPAGHAALRGPPRTSSDVEEAPGGAAVGVLEMSGRAGDVFLMDMRVLHTPSINASRNVRMMATARFFFSA
mgnify:CR=1 FL=1